MAGMDNQYGKFLIFTLQDSLYAFDLAQVAEVSDPPELWPIPLAPAYYSGVFSFHGDIVAAIRLSLFLGLDEISEPGKMIVLRQEAASLAFLVDSVFRIVSEEDVSFTPTPDNAYSARSLIFFDRKATQLDLERVVYRAGIDMQKSRLDSKMAL